MFKNFKNKKNNDKSYKNKKKNNSHNKHDLHLKKHGNKKNDEFFVPIENLSDNFNNDNYYVNPDTGYVHEIPNNDTFFTQQEVNQKNLSYDALYTKEDLEFFNLSDQEVTKFFKNGTVFYKLKKPIDENDGTKSIFKKNTKFSIQTLGQWTEDDPFFSDVKHYKNFEIDSILTTNDGVNDKLKKEIYQLNKELEAKLSHIEQYNVREDELENIANAHRLILKQQKEIQEKIYSLRDDYANSSVFYRIQNLQFNTWNEDDIYFGYKISNISFDIYAGDRIVIVSDNSITNQLLIDILRGDESKTGGYIYKNLTRSQKWIDIENVDYNQYKIESMNLNEEIYYGLTSPDYLSFGTNKKDNAGTTLNKILATLSVSVSNEFKNKLIKLMKFDSCMSRHIFELDDLNLEKFVTICDILIGKKIVLIKSICQGMNYNEKIALFRFLNKYFENKKITVLYASDDYLEANLVATKIMVLKEGYLIENKKVNYILNQFNSINDYVLYTLKFGVIPNLNE